MIYVVASHIQYDSQGEETYGPPHHILDLLISKNKEVIFIKHDIEGERKTIIAAKSTIYKDYKLSKGFVFRTFQQVIINLQVTKYHDQKVFYIGVDPINSLSGAILKILRRTKKNIYLTPDYADRRFQNIVLNSIYHCLDRICLFFADEVWSVSSRIVRKRTMQGVAKNKNKLLPNSPNIRNLPYHQYDGNKNLIIVSHLTKSLDFPLIVDIVGMLHKDYKDANLYVVGTGPELERFKRLVEKKKLGKNIHFLGQKKHKDVLDIISQSFLGFALYTDDQAWNIYGDSMKAREYVACGIPVIINEVPSTADDIKEGMAGLVLSNNNNNIIIYKFIKKCMDDKSYYLRLRNNARELGLKFDKEKILEGLLFDN